MAAGIPFVDFPVPQFRKKEKGGFLGPVGALVGGGVGLVFGGPPGALVGAQVGALAGQTGQQLIYGSGGGPQFGSVSPDILGALQSQGGQESVLEGGAASRVDPGFLREMEEQAQVQGIFLPPSRVIEIALGGR
jgi:hypothetical protein